MPDLQNLSPKICFTAAGILVHEKKVLLIKHKKLGIWLNPGGHIEENELPHHAAVREFFEETGVKVRVVSAQKMLESHESEYLPLPLSINLHWISKGNCEQHLTFLYLVEATGDLNFTHNEKETTGIKWFSEKDLATLETTQDVKNEIKYALHCNS